MCKKESFHSHLERTCQVLGQSRLWEESPALQVAILQLSVHRWTPMAQLCMRMLPASSSFPTVAFVATGLENYTVRSLGCLVLSTFVFFLSLLSSKCD